MTAITHRIPDTGLFHRLLCGARIHEWARWELLTAELKTGRSSREIVVNVRECICCGLSQQKIL